MDEKRKYDVAFKQEALRLLEISGKSVRQIEAELGITPGLLNKWKLRYRLQPVSGELKPSEVSIVGRQWFFRKCRAGGEQASQV